MTQSQSNNNRGPRDIVEFPPNVPVTIALKYPTAKLFSNEHGERAMFTTVENRVCFLDLHVAKQITDLGVNTREPFTITKKSSGKRDEPITWDVARIPASSAIGQQADGTFAVPTLSETTPTLPEAKPPARAASSAAARSLVEEANALVDAYAEVLARGLTTYQGRVKPDEIRSLLISAYIQRSKLSSVA